jgi:hypothetical protein
VSATKFESGLLGLEQLKDLLLHEEVKAEYNLDSQMVRRIYRDAFVTGEFKKFVVGATHRLLELRASNTAFATRSTPFFLEMLKGVIHELPRATALEEQRMQKRGRMQAESKRFGDLAGLLEECFGYASESLRRWPGSTVGVQELSVVADEIDQAGGIDEDEACRHVFLLNDPESFTPRSFRILADAVIEQLREWRHPLRLEIAFDKLLDVMPKLEETVFGKLPTGAWGAMLMQHGMKESAEQLAAAVSDRRTAALGGSYVNTSALSFSLDPVLIKLVEDWQRRIPLEMNEFKDTFPEEVSQDDGEMTSDEDEHTGLWSPT